MAADQETAFEAQQRGATASKGLKFLQALTGPPGRLKLNEDPATQVSKDR
jgi:hypothetical protein